MAYRPYIWRKNNPEKRLEQKRREKVRRSLRDLGIFPHVGEQMNEQQKLIDQQISNNDFSYWDSIKKSPKPHDGGDQNKNKIKIKSNEYIIWYRSKQTAKARGFEFNLDIEDIIIPDKCPLLEIDLSFGVENKHLPNYYSIDRIDNSKGYIKGNVQIISRLANTMKNNATKEQLITFSKNILKIHNT
jgi:hypothetical protein